jgi:hypothetical protein
LLDRIRWSITAMQQRERNTMRHVYATIAEVDLAIQEHLAGILE